MSIPDPGCRDQKGTGSRIRNTGMRYLTSSVNTKVWRNFTPKIPCCRYAKFMSTNYMWPHILWIWGALVTGLASLLGLFVSWQEHCSTKTLLWIRHYFLRIRILPSTRKKRENPWLNYFVTSFWLFIFENWCKCTFKKYRNQHENLKKFYFLFGILSATDEKSQIQIHKSVEPYGSAAPNQNVTDPQYWIKNKFGVFILSHPPKHLSSGKSHEGPPALQKISSFVFRGPFWHSWFQIQHPYPDFTDPITSGTGMDIGQD